MIRFAFLFTLLGGCLLLGCGGSGPQTAGIDGSGAPVAITNSNGTIDGFGSVLVNGVKYESDQAQILINAQSASENDLCAGYQVSISGTLASDGTATASKIEFSPSLVGEISAIETNNNRLLVLGKTVQISNNTLFDGAIKPASLAGLAAGQRILVSGAIAGDGSISATRIELAGGSTVQISGAIEYLTSNSFSLNGTPVVYSGAQLINLDNNRLINGAHVTALGLMVNNQLQATVVIGLNKTLSRALERADIEGFITRFASATDFDVAGISATSTSQTRVENGTLSDLRLGAKVELEGSVNAKGILVASKVELEQHSNNKLSGTVTGINLTATSGIVSGVLEVDGTAITTSKQTRYEDKKLDLKRFNLGSINLGDEVEVTGYSTAEGFIATKIERKAAADNSDEIREFEGVISALGADYFMLFGRKIYLTDTTLITGSKGNLLSLAAFYVIALNQQVEVRGIDSNGNFYATEIELEDKDEDEDEHKPGNKNTL